MMKKTLSPSTRRKTRVRARLKAHSTRPRLTIFRSNQHIYAQIIDDTQGITLAAASDLNLPKSETKLSKIDRAISTGKLLASNAQKNKIESVSFDRGPYKYHGRVKALAAAARQHGLKF